MMTKATVLKAPPASKSKPPSRPTAASRDLKLGRRLGIDAANLEIRREFVRLTSRERGLLLDLVPWAQSAAPDIAREFYDFQFSFAPTRRFFERFAAQKGLPVDQLRQVLEQSQ